MNLATARCPRRKRSGARGRSAGTRLGARGHLGEAELSPRSFPGGDWSQVWTGGDRALTSHEGAFLKYARRLEVM